MVIGKEQVRFTRQLLLLWLKVLLFHSGWSSVVLSQSQGNPEVMIPLKILDSAPSEKPSEWISYRMKFNGQEQVIHMKVTKFLLARNMPVFTYTDQGALSLDHPFIQNNCYYYGYVQGDLLSQVSLNSCFGGFNGILQKNNTVYKIEPKLNSTTFEHLVYKLVSEKNDLPARRCGSMDDESQCEFKVIKTDQLATSKQSGYVGWWIHKRYLRLVIVVDNKMFRHYRSNTTFTNDNLLPIMNVVIANYVQFDLTITLVGIEIWTDKDPIPYDPKIKHVIPFCKWKEQTLNLRTSHHLAHLLYMFTEGNTIYHVYPNVVCRTRLNCASNLIEDYQSMDIIALIITRTVAVNIGVGTDEIYCACGQTFCIMYRRLQPSHVFSNCSYSQFYQAKTDCLLRPPKKEETLGEERCGNGKLEEGEDCDCGTISSCAKDPCCDANCKLAPGAICAFGLCCRNCKLLPAGTLCRKRKNECDLPEWCNGTYHECPEDVYVQGGVSCKDGGFCHGKRCRSRQEQCRRIFGDQAKSARLSCYVDVNNKGDRFGNCAYSTKSYKPCAIKDSQCGRIQCEITKNPLSNLQSHSTVISTNINGVNCWGIDYHYGAHTPDLGEVEDGTECGENHICVDRRCVPMSYFTNHCSPKKCSMHGICNNRNHCHCDSPWRPPFCNEPGNKAGNGAGNEAGNGAGNEAGIVGGGSVDSGPPSGSHQDGGDSTESEGSTQSEDFKHSHICYFLLLLRFMVFLLIFIGVMLKAVI